MNKGLVGHFFIIVGPSGAGKGTLINKLVQDFPMLKKTLSHTTRQPKPHEQPNNYHFITRDEYKQMLDNNDILMHYHYKPNNEFYGTSKQETLTKLNQGHYIIDESDEASIVDMVDNKLLERTLFSTIYIMPSSPEQGAKRINKDHYSKQEYENRVLDITKRIQHYSTIRQYFDLEIINDDLDIAYTKLKDYIKKIIIS